MPERENREKSENLLRSRHCNDEFFLIEPLNGKARNTVNLSQETCQVHELAHYVGLSVFAIIFVVFKTLLGSFLFSGGGLH